MTLLLLILILLLIVLLILLVLVLVLDSRASKSRSKSRKRMMIRNRGGALRGAAEVRVPLLWSWAREAEPVVRAERTASRAPGTLSSIAGSGDCVASAGRRDADTGDGATAAGAARPAPGMPVSARNARRPVRAAAHHAGERFSRAPQGPPWARNW